MCRSAISACFMNFVFFRLPMYYSSPMTPVLPRATAMAIFSLVAGREWNQQPVGVGDGVDQSRRRSVDDDLPDGFGSEGPCGFIAALEFHLQFSHIQPGRDLVLHKGIISEFSFRGILDVLKQGHAHGLHQASFHLDPGQVGIDGCSAVHHRRVVQDPDLPGLLVQLDLHGSRHKGRGRDGRAVADRDLQGMIIAAHGTGGNVHQGDLPALVPQGVNPAAVKFQFLRRQFQGSAPLLQDQLPQLPAGLLHSLAGNVSGTGGVGSGIVGRSIRIRRRHGDLVQLTVQTLRGDLGQNGVAAGSHIRGTDRQHVASIII